VLVRVHEPFHSIDMFDFDASRHAYSVQDAMRMIAHHKEGVIVLLRRHEAPEEVLERFSPHVSPSRAVRKWDPSCTASGAQILRDLGVGRMASSPARRRIPSMAGFGLEVVGYVSPDGATQVKPYDRLRPPPQGRPASTVAIRVEPLQRGHRARAPHRLRPNW